MLILIIIIRLKANNLNKAKSIETMTKQAQSQSRINIIIKGFINLREKSECTIPVVIKLTECRVLSNF